MNKFKNILILAGGDSTRFWPLAQKSYFSFLGKPLVFHQIEKIKGLAENIFIVINSSDKHYFHRLKNLKYKLISQKKELKGQAGAILSTKDKFTGETLILNAEDIFNYSILSQYDNPIRQKKDLLLLAKKVKKYFPGGYLKFKSGVLDQIIEKPPEGREPSDLTRLVVDYYSNINSLFTALEKTKSLNDDLYERAINLLLKQNNKSGYILYDDFWFALKYPWHVLPLTNYFLSSLNKEIALGKNVKIAKTAKIEGPCYIDDNTIIGDFALVRQSHIGKNCLIGGYSEVTRSYLGNNVFLHRNYIGDSVLADNVLFGAQAVTANFRFDAKTIKSTVNGKKVNTDLEKFGAIIGANSKIGVNTTLLPGVKIGRNTFVGPGETVDDDIEDNIFTIKGKKVKNRIL